MNFIAVLDTSTLIWDKSDFEENKHTYYKLVLALPDFFDVISDHRLQVLLREELRVQIECEFPYSITESLFFDFQRRFLTFMGGLGARMIQFPAQNSNTINTHPPIIKTHYSPETNQEISYLIYRLYNVRQQVNKYFTFYPFWQNSGSLVVRDSDELEVETICFDDVKAIETFLNNNVRRFEHNPKHNQYKTGGNISKLSCYNDRIRDITQAQTLLDDAILEGKSLFNYDELNNVYVQFVLTGANIYHGWDEINVTQELKIRIKAMQDAKRL